jgi:serine protease Do
MKHFVRRKAYGFVLVALAAALAIPAAQAADKARREQLKREIAQLNKQTQAFRELFKKTIELTMDSVVSITTKRKVAGGDLPDMFDRRLPYNAPKRPMPRREQAGIGSGFVIHSDGYIVTNYHVVEKTEPENIKVMIRENGKYKEYIAEKVWLDENTELAVVKIDAKNLPALEWGDSTDLAVGEWVIAIGSPMGLGNTATTGVVSATSTKDRVISGDSRHDLSIIRRKTGYAVEDYIQTDAAINPGNSGGPLITLSGKIIGINTLIVSSTRSSAGLGFAVPQKIAQPVVAQLMKRGRVVRGHLGVGIMNPSDLTDAAAWELFKVKADAFRNKFRIKKNDTGVLILNVMPGSAAAKGGIQQGDLIKSIDGVDMPNTDALRTRVASIAPGTKIKVKLLRKRDWKTLTITLGEQPSRTTVAANTGVTATVESLGLTVQTLTPDVAKALGYKGELKGVLITDIKKGGRAEKSGLKLDDVILSVNRSTVESASGFRKVVGALGDKGIAVRIQRDETKKYISIVP